MEQSRDTALVKCQPLCDPACAHRVDESSCRRHGIIDAHQTNISAAIRPVIGANPSDFQKRTHDALLTSNQALVRCRETLRWIYVAKYFFPPAGPVDLFQSNQDDLEGHTERLNHMIEKNWSEMSETLTGGDLYEKLHEMLMASDRVLGFMEKICTAPEFENYFDVCV